MFFGPKQHQPTPLCRVGSFPPPCLFFESPEDSPRLRGSLPPLSGSGGGGGNTPLAYLCTQERSLSRPVMAGAEYASLARSPTLPPFKARADRHSLFPPIFHPYGEGFTES